MNKSGEVEKFIIIKQEKKNEEWILKNNLTKEENLRKEQIRIEKQEEIDRVTYQALKQRFEP